MNWLIQTAFIPFNNVRKVWDTVISSGGEPYEAILFKDSDEIQFPELLKDDNNIVVYGSTRLSKFARQNGWNGSFLNDNFNVNTWQGNSNDMLNNFSMEFPLSCIPAVLKSLELRKTFMRPVVGSKIFNGGTFNYASVVELLETVDGDTMVSISPLTTIYEEYRFFIVDRKVISGSLYRKDDTPIRQLVTSNDILDIAQRFADRWLPHDCCVMDIALTSTNERSQKYFKIIEFNCLNSSGFYDCDVSKIINAVNQYMSKYIK